MPTFSACSSAVSASSTSAYIVQVLVLPLLLANLSATLLATVTNSHTGFHHNLHQQQFTCLAFHSVSPSFYKLTTLGTGGVGAGGVGTGGVGTGGVGIGGVGKATNSRRSGSNIHATGSQTQKIWLQMPLQALSQTLENDAPFPDTVSLNNALQDFAKSNVINDYDHDRTAQYAENLLFKCEQWYDTQIQNGYSILQPCQFQRLLTENDNDHDTHTSSRDNIIVGPIPDTFSYSSVIDAWAKIGNYQRALQLLNKMYELDKQQQEQQEPSASESLRNIKPNTITYNSVINSLCISIQHGLITNKSLIESTPLTAQNILEEMKQHVIHKTNLSCIPDTTTFNTVMKVWSYSSRNDSGYYAEKLLHEMWLYHDQYQKYLHSNSSYNNNTQLLLLNVTPDLYSYSTAITAWARSTMTNNSTSAKRAEQLLEQMEGYRSKGYTHLAPTTYCVNAVLNAWSKVATTSSAYRKFSGAGHRAEKILRRMEDLYNQGGRDELCPNTISYNTVISAYARSGELGSERSAERILKRMDRLSRQQEQQRDHYNDNDEPNTNDENNNKSCKPDLISYNSVINAWSRSKDPEGPIRAEAILNHMEKQNKNGLSSIQPDVVSYTSCIAAWARSNNNITPHMAHNAQKILDRMDEAYRAGNIKAKPTVLSYNTVCNAWAKSRDKHAAKKVLSILDKMEQMHTNGEMYVKPDIFTYTTCIDALAKEGTTTSAEKAIELLNTIEKRYNETLDNDIKPNVRTYTSVINAISRSKLGPARADALLARIEELGGNGNDKDLNVDVVCFNAVLNAWGWSSEAGKARRADEILQKMMSLYNSGQNNDAKPDLITLNSLLNACAFSNVNDELEKNEAVDIAIKAYEMYQSAAPLYGMPNHVTYGTLLMIFNKMLPQSELRDELMKNVFYNCCENGHLSGFVVSQLQHGFSGSTLEHLFGNAVVNDGTNIVIDKRKVPREWSRFTGGSKSRPSKKRMSRNVTRQQMSRSQAH